MGGVQNIDGVEFDGCMNIESVKCISAQKFNEEHFKDSKGIKSLLVSDDAIDTLSDRLKEIAKRTKTIYKAGELIIV